MRCRPRRSFGSPRTKTGPGLYGQVMDSQKELHSYSREATLEADTVCRPPDPGVPFILPLHQGARCWQRVRAWTGSSDGTMEGATGLCSEEESKLFKGVENVRDRSSDAQSWQMLSRLILTLFAPRGCAGHPLCLISLDGDIMASV